MRKTHGRFAFTLKKLGYLLLATLVMLPLLLVPYPARLIVADDNEVIVSVEIVDAETGSSVTRAAVHFRSSSGTTQTVRHRRHATVEEADFVILQALPPSGYLFHHWEGFESTGDEIASVAFFEDAAIRLVVSNESDPDEEANGDDDSETPASGGGAIPRDPNTSGEALTLESPADRSTRAGIDVWVDFNHVGIEDGSATNPFNTTVEGASAVDATTADTIKFQPGVSQENLTIASVMTLMAPNGSVRIGVSAFAVSFTLTVLTQGSGNVTGAGGYIDGTNATVNAAASSGWAFSHWIGDLTGTADPETVLMDRDKSVTAVFVQNPANLQVSNLQLNGGGSLPSAAKAGDVLTIDFDVDNGSGNAADSADDDWTDNIFLSRDATFGSDDKPLNATGTTISEQESYTATVSITIPDVSPGDYFLIMRADTEDEVTHTASDRAAGVATHGLTIIDSELTQ